MFGTPTSTVGSIFDIMRSPPSVDSRSHHKHNENVGTRAANSALSRPSKSSASVASYGSSHRDQPSCSTYSASASTVAGSGPGIFKRQYIAQAVRLVDDALTEQDKVDCYLASLEYLLSAVSTDTNLHRQIGTVDRQEIVHAKLSSFIRRTEEFSPATHEHETTSSSTVTPIGWWNGVWGSTVSRNKPRETAEISVSMPSELAAQCGCGRKVLVKIPECFLPQTVPNHQPEVQRIEHRNFIAAWYGWAFGLIVSAISIINGFVLPSMISLFIRTVVTVIVYLEKRYDVVNMILNFFVNMIKLLLQISQHYNFNKQFGDFCSWLVTKLVNVALNFVKTDDIKNLNMLFDLTTKDKQNGPQDYERNPSNANVGSNHFHIPEAALNHQFNHKFTNGGDSSSSPSTVRSDSTYQLNHKNHKPSNFFNNKSSNLSYGRTSRHKF